MIQFENFPLKIILATIIFFNYNLYYYILIITLYSMYRVYENFYYSLDQSFRLFLTSHYEKQLCEHLWTYRLVLGKGELVLIIVSESVPDVEFFGSKSIEIFMDLDTSEVIFKWL